MKKQAIILLIILSGYAKLALCQLNPVVSSRGNKYKDQGLNLKKVLPQNFKGTNFEKCFKGLPKTGSIQFLFNGNVVNPPAIDRVWINGMLTSIVVGPAFIYKHINGHTEIAYDLYKSDIPSSNGIYTVEFVDPQTNSVWSLCDYDCANNEVIPAPRIISQPQNQQVCMGTQAVLSVFASAYNRGVLSYQWRKSGIDIKGANSNLYIIKEVEYVNEGVYDCLISESNGSLVLSNEVTLSLNKCQLPKIKQQPYSTTVCAGLDAKLAVVAEAVNGGHLRYQWRKDGMNISGATSAVYFVSSAELGNKGVYDCVVKESNGLAAVSEKADLSVIVCVPPLVQEQPKSQIVSLGKSLELKVTAAPSNGGSLTYQWRKDGVNIQSANNPVYTVSIIKESDLGEYTCVITESIGGFTVSEIAKVEGLNTSMQASFKNTTVALGLGNK